MLIKLRDIFEPGRLFVELQDHGFPEQPVVNGALVEAAKKLELPLVATNDVHFLRRDDGQAQLYVSEIPSPGNPVFDNLVFSQICGAIVLMLALVGLAITSPHLTFLQSSTPMGVSPPVHFSHFCLCLRGASVARRLTTAYSSLRDVRRLLHRCPDRVAVVGLFRPPKELSRSDSVPTRWSKVVLWTQGLVVGVYLCIQGVNWTYGQHLMAEWNLTRWHARARLHFLGKLPTYSGPNLLGGNEEIISVLAGSLEKLVCCSRREPLICTSRLWAGKSPPKVRKKADSMH